MRLPLFSRKRRLLVVCRANVCRSPMAQGLLQRALDARGMGRERRVESAGTEVQVSGRKADPRAVRILGERGVPIGRHRARPVSKLPLERYDKILAVDNETYLKLKARLPEALQGRLGKLMDYAPAGSPEGLPDPYFGTDESFREVLRQLDTVVPWVLEEWR